MKKDVVYIFRQGPIDSLEFRFSLRSLQNIEYRNVYVIGYKPEWLQNVIHIPYKDNQPIKVLNALYKIKEICLREDVSEDFILMNDDFYALRATTVEYRHQGPIQKHVDRRMKLGQGNSKYFMGLLQTKGLFPDGLDYEVHRPMIYNKSKFLKMLDKYCFTNGMLLRNTYGNEYDVGGKQIGDLKIHKYRDVGNEEWLSSDDDCIQDPKFIDFMLDKFPNISKYEFYNINGNKMLAKANFNITIDGKVYNKGVVYEINKSINTKHPLNGKMFFDDVVSKETENKTKPEEKEVMADVDTNTKQTPEVSQESSEAQSDEKREYSIDELIAKLKEKKVFVMKNWKDETIMRKARENGIIS